HESLQYLRSSSPGVIGRRRRGTQVDRRVLRSLVRLRRLLCCRDRHERAVGNGDLAGVARKSSRRRRQDGPTVGRAPLIRGVAYLFFLELKQFNQVTRWIFQKPGATGSRLTDLSSEFDSSSVQPADE